MSKLGWNEPGDRRFFTGVDRGVLYVFDEKPVSHLWDTSFHRWEETTEEVARDYSQRAPRNKIYRQKDEPKGFYHRWSGTIRGSRSDKLLDGVVVASNLLTKPSIASGGFYWTNMGDVNENGVLLNAASYSSSASSPPGTTVGGSADVWSPDARRVLLQTRGAINGSFGSESATARYLELAPGYQRVVFPDHVLAPSSNSFRLQFAGTTIGGIRIDRVMMASGTDDKSAYFDGDTPDDLAGAIWITTDEGVAWNGLTQVVEQPTGGEAQPYYIDGVKYLNVPDQEEFAGTISAVYSPEEFDVCDGSIEVSDGVLANQQLRRPFGFSFRNKVANDVSGLEAGHQIHMIFDAVAHPSNQTHNTMSGEVDLEPLSWSFTTRPMPFPGLLPTSHIWVDTTKIHPRVTTWIEEILYGTDKTPPRLPPPDELLFIFRVDPELFVVDNGNGTVTVSGNDDAVRTFLPDVYELTSSAVVDVRDDGQFTLIYL